MLAGDTSDIIDFDQSLDRDDFLLAKKDVKEVVEPTVPSLLEEDLPQDLLTAVTSSPPFRKISDIKMYHPPTPMKPREKRPKIITRETFLERIARFAQENPQLSFIPRLQRLKR